MNADFSCKAEARLVFIVESYQDVETFNSLFQKYSNDIEINLKAMPLVIILEKIILSMNDSGREVMELLKDSEIFFVANTGKVGEIYMNDFFEMFKNIVSNFYHFVFSIQNYFEMSDGQCITDYLNVKKERKIIREKIILELLFNRKDLFDWKVSKKFVDFDKNGKLLKTKNNIISYVKYKNGGKLYDLATKEYSFFYNGDIIDNPSIISFSGTIKNDLLTKEELNIQRKEIEDVIENESSCLRKTHSFIEMMKENQNNDHFMIKQLFKKLKFAEGVDEKLMHELFEKFIMIIISISHNDYENNPIVDQNIVPIFLSRQGKGKSTFIMDLMLYNASSNDDDVKNSWCNNIFSIGHGSQNEMRDTILNNKKGVLAEIPEIGLKLMLNDPEFLKAYTSSRSSITRKYSKNSENHISNTSMIFTTNNRKIINDNESRRFPVFDLESIERIRMDDGNYIFDIKSFWGAAYDFWLKNGKSALAKCSTELSKRISEHNKKYSIEDNATDIIEEIFDLFDIKRKFNYLGKNELRHILNVLFNHAVRNNKNHELNAKIDSFIDKYNVKYASYRIPDDSNPKKGYAFPMFNMDTLTRIIAKKRQDNSFISDDSLENFKKQLDEQKQRYKFNKATKEEEIMRQRALIEENSESELAYH